MSNDLRYLIIGLGATALFAFLPSAISMSKKIAIPGALLSFFLTIWLGWPDIIWFLHKIQGAGNEDTPLWTPYLLGLIFALLVIGFGNLIVVALKAKFTRLRLHITFLDQPPVERWRWLTCNIIGWNYVRNIESGVTKTCDLWIAFRHPIIIDNLQVEFLDGRNADYTRNRINSRFAIIQFTGEVSIGTFIITVGK